MKCHQLCWCNLNKLCCALSLSLTPRQKCNGEKVAHGEKMESTRDIGARAPYRSNRPKPNKEIDSQSVCWMCSKIWWLPSRLGVIYSGMKWKFRTRSMRSGKSWHIHTNATHSERRKNLKNIVVTLLASVHDHLKNGHALWHRTMHTQHFPFRTSQLVPYNHAFAWLFFVWL